MATKVKRKIAAGLFTALMVSVVIFLILIRFSFFQTWLTHKVTKILSDYIGHEVRIEKVRISFFSHVQLDKVYIEDDRHDTLLYANYVDVSLRNVNVFKKTITIKKLRLDDLRVNMIKDSADRMNFSGIFDHFKAKNDTKKVAAKTDTTGKAWDFAFQAFEINKLRLLYYDEGNDGKLNLTLDKGNIKIKSLDIKKPLVSFNQVWLDHAEIYYTRGTHPKDLLSTSSHNIHLLGKMLIKYENLKVKNSHFTYNDWNKKKAPAGMDYFHLDVKKINIDISQGKIDHDTIFGKIEKLSCLEKCGFAIKEFKSQARVSTSDIECKDLYLKTENSLVQNYLQFRYDSFPDFKDFISKVRIKAQLRSADISLKDINYFAKGKLDKIDHNRVLISGDIKGRVDDFRGHDIEMKLAERTTFKGNFSLNGLPNIKETLISLKVDELSSDPTDVRRIYPHLNYPSNFPTLGKMNFKGSFDGFISDFVTAGELQTALGRLVADLNFKLPENQNPTYSGKLISYDFNLGRWFSREDMLGPVSLNVNIKGSGLKLNTLNANLSGNVSAIVVKGYEYGKITIDGTFEKKTFEGNLVVNDENLDLEFKGLVNLNDSLPRFQLQAFVEHADLQKLNLIKDHIQVHCNADLDFSGKKIDEIAGDIHLTDLIVKTDSAEYPITELNLNSFKTREGIRHISLISGILDADIDGKFNFAQLPKIFKTYIDHFSMSPKRINFDTIGYARMNFNFRIYEPGSLTLLITPAFKLIRNSVISGSFDSQKHNLDFTATVPQFKFGPTDFRTIKLQAHSIEDSMLINLSFQKMLIKDSLWVKNSRFQAQFMPEKRSFRIDLIAEGDTSANRIALHGNLGTTLSKVMLSLDHSSITINENEWKFRDENSITYSKKYLHTTNLIVYNGDKELYITTTHPADSTTNVEFDLSNISVHDISKLFDHSNNNYFGLANGSLELRNIFNKASYFGNIYVANLGVNKDTLGNLSMYSNIEDIKDKIPVECKLKGKYNDIVFKGYYSPGLKENRLNFEADIKRFKVDFINNYLARYVTQAAGTAIGKININGTDKKPELTGFINLQNCEATVAYINTHYRLKNEIVIFKDNEIRFDGVKVLDEKDNVAYAGGKIKHNYLRDFFFDIYLNTDNFQMLKTTQSFNPVFWGTGYGTGVALFKGPVRNMVIHIEASTTKGSVLTIPIRTTAETNNYSFYRFISNGDTSSPIQKKGKPKALLNVQLDLDITPDCEINLILDPVAGDNLKVNGEGNIKVNVNESADLSIYGDYKILSGNYFFTLPTLVNKSFRIDKGSAITFTGDIYEANLDVKAIYPVRAMPYELIQEYFNSATDGDIIARAKKRIPVDLLLSLSGQLRQPIINFDMRIKDLDPSLQTAVDQKMASIKSNPNELNKQVAGLLLTGGFFPNFISGTNTVTTTASSTVSEFLSTQISKYLSSLIGNFVPGLDFVVKYKPYSTTDNTGKQGVTGNEFYFGVNQKLLNDRIIVNVGGNVDLSKQGATTNRFNGDFSIEYQMTRDGRVRLKAFNRSDVDYFAAGERTTNVKTGAGISYREEFENFADLREQYKERAEKRRQRKEQKKMKKTLEQGVNEILPPR